METVKNQSPEVAGDVLGHNKWPYLSSDLFDDFDIFRENYGIEALIDGTTINRRILGKIPNRPEYGSLAGKTHGRYALARIYVSGTSSRNDPSNNSNNENPSGGAIAYKYYLLADEIKHGWGYGGGENVCLDMFEGSAEDARQRFATFGFFSEDQQDILGAAAIHGTPAAGEQTIPSLSRFEHLQGAPFRRFCLIRVRTLPVSPFLRENENTEEPTDPTVGGRRRTKKVRKTLKRRKNRKVSKTYRK